MKNTALSLILSAMTMLAWGCGSSNSVESDWPAVDNNYSKPMESWYGDDRPFADMYNTTSRLGVLEVRGRLVEDDEDEIQDPDVKPTHLLSEHEIKDQRIQLMAVIDDAVQTIGDVKTDHEGYLDTHLDISGLGFQPGTYAIKVVMDGKIAGGFFATLLDANRQLPVVRSDVDLTYLDTDFQSATSILRLVREDASDKVALPGMPAIYQALRNDGALPITFLSGSPRFFKRTIENKMKLDRVAQDGLVLKPLKDGVSSNLLSLEPGDILPEAKEQVGYKLFWLFKLRKQLPNTTPEILMGDDSEADHVIYNLYYRYLNEEISLMELETTLKTVGVTDAWLRGVVNNAGALNPADIAAPLVIYINKTEVPGDHFPIRDWAIEGVTIHHAGALELVEDLQTRGWVSVQAVESVRDAL